MKGDKNYEEGARSNMTFKDFIDSLKMAYYGCSFEVKDPLAKIEVEKKLEELGIRCLKGYTDFLGVYSYVVVGGKKKKVMEFLEWFKGDGELKCFTSKNMVTRTPMYSFYRASEYINLSEYEIK